MIGLFDIGGTHTRVAVSKDGSRLDSIRSFETPKDFDAGMKALADGLNGLSAGSPFEAVAGGFPGNLGDGIISGATHLQEWNGKDIVKGLEKLFPESTIYIENDADMACLGEAVYGAGKGFRTVAYYTISTGIGGGLVTDGKIDKGEFDFEPGHQIMDEATGASLEDLASGTSVIKRYGKRYNDLGEVTLRILARHIAVGMDNSVAHWSPDIFVLGGSITLEVKGLFEAIVEEFTKLPAMYAKRPELKKAALGDESGLYGALAIAGRR